MRPHETRNDVDDRAASRIATLAAENERLRALNAQLMGDDEAAPRYTTKRLRHEVEERTKVLAAENATLKARCETLADALAEQNIAVANLVEELSEARGDIGMLNVKDAAHIAARHDMRDEIATLKAELAAANQARAVTAANLELRLASIAALRLLVRDSRIVFDGLAADMRFLSHCIQEGRNKDEMQQFLDDMERKALDAISRARGAEA